MSPETVAWIAGTSVAFVLANIGAVFGIYVSMRERIVKLEVYVDILQKDMNALGNMNRETQKLLKGVEK